MSKPTSLNIPRHRPKNAGHQGDNRFIHLVDQLSSIQWFGLWMVTVVGCGLVYWGLTMAWVDHGIVANVSTVSDTDINLWGSLYFSCVTVTTLGYGDLTPHGLSRVVAVLESGFGLFIVGALISKLLSRNQEKLILETNDLAFNERVGRILTDLHTLLIEFQQAAESPPGHVQDPAKSDRRLTSASLKFIHTLQAVNNLLEGNRNPDSRTMLNMMMSLHNTLLEFGDTTVFGDSDRPPFREAVLVATEVQLICAECLPVNAPGDVRECVQKVKMLAEDILSRPWC